MKKIKIFAAAVMFCTATFAGYTAYEKATMTDAERMMLANIEALSTKKNESDLGLDWWWDWATGGGNDDNDDDTQYKLTVCLCSDQSPTNGYYDFADMKNHCHEGSGNDCAGRVDRCEYTWYCGL